MSTSTTHATAGGPRDAWHAVDGISPAREWRFTHRDSDMAGVPLTLRITHPTWDSSEVAERVVKALEVRSGFDFRTSDSLASELGLDPTEITEALDLLVDQRRVRRPIGLRYMEEDWYRLVSHGLTWRERWNRLRANLGRDLPPPT